MPFTIAILGRPNVGKSTLFNRLAGKRQAIVHGEPGVTRDWKRAPARLADLSFDVIDTAGLEEGTQADLVRRMRERTEKVLAEEADAALLLIDAREGVTPIDEKVAGWVRKSGKPVVLAANKCEGRGAEQGFFEAYKLGFGEPVAVSAEHGEGMAELYRRLAPLVEAGAQAMEPEQPETPLKLAIVGRPNAGKSTLINRLVGKERLVTGPEPGITRDSVAVEWAWQGQPVRLFDTAGLRRKARITRDLEKMAAADARRAIDFTEVAVLLVDAEEGFSHQEGKIANRIVEEGRALVLAVNKIDAIDDSRTFRSRARAELEARLPHARGVEVVFLSALTGKGVEGLMPAVLRAHRVWNKRIPTARLNRWLERAVAENPPPTVKGRRLKARYLAQVSTRPPKFALFVNRPKDFPESYLRYLENGLRGEFALPGVPIRLNLRTSENPYRGKAKKRT